MNVFDALGSVIRHSLNDTGLGRLLPTLTDAVPRGKPRPLGPDLTGQVTVTAVAGAGGTLAVEPKAGARASLVFFHGFGHHVDEHVASASVLAKDGKLNVELPPLPGFKGLNALGYHQEVCEAALAAWDAAAARAKAQGLPPPMVGGYSLGGGAALYVAARRNVPAVLWAPMKLDGPIPRSAAPVLVLEGGLDKLVGAGPAQLAAAQPRATLRRLEGATHTGFADTDRFAWAEGEVKKTTLTPDAQRFDAIKASLAFLEAQRVPASGWDRRDSFTP